MASQITLILWTDHPADPSLASDLAQQAAAQIFRSSSLAAAVISATSTDIQVHDIEAAVKAFADAEAPEVAPAEPVVVTDEVFGVAPPSDPEPQPTYSDGAPIPTPAVEVAPPVTEVVSAPLAVVDTPAAETAPADVPEVVPPAVAPDATAASAGLVTPLPDPATQVVDSDEHMAVLVQLFEALSPEEKTTLDAEVHTLEDAHAALERIYAPLVALENPPA